MVLTRLAILILLAAVALPGCQTLQERGKAKALDAVLSQYRTSMRWGYWDTLAGFRHPDAPAMPDLDLDNVRVTSYDERQGPVPVEEDRVMQVVEIQYVLQDQQRVRKLVEQQDWRYDTEKERWYLHSPFPALK